MLVSAHSSPVPNKAPVSSMVNCFNLMSDVPEDVSLDYRLRQAKPKEQHSRFEIYK